MTTLSLKKETLQASLEKLTSQKDALDDLRKSAFCAFEKKGLPSRKEEAFQYLKLGGLYSKSLQMPEVSHANEDLLKEALYPYQDQSFLVFYNGRFVPRYSQYEELEDDLVILPFSEAYLTYRSFFQDFFDSWIKKEQDPFALLSLSLNPEGLFVYVPKNTVLKKELHIIELFDVEPNSILTPVTLFSLGAHASLKLSSVSFGKDSEESLISSYWGFHLDQEAKVNFTQGIDQSKSNRFDALRVQQKGQTRFKQVQMVLDPSKARASSHIELLGEGAESEILSLAALKKEQEAHVHILMEHKAPHCESRQLVKNLLDEKATASFEGKIKVDSIAQKTNAYQLNANCILSDEANAYSKPNLEIFADDVKASHGSTTGQIDKEQLFYLQSRGLSIESAKKILLKGFCDEITEVIDSPLMRTKFSKKLNQYFS